MDGFIDFVILVFTKIFQAISWLLKQLFDFIKWVLSNIYNHGFMTIYYTVLKWTSKSYKQKVKPKLQQLGVVAVKESKVSTPTTEPK